MNVLAFNCGSSSLKYSLLDMPGERPLARGEAQRVGPKTAEPARIVHEQAGQVQTRFAELPDHAAAFERVLATLEESGLGAPDAIAHRVVHGGARFSASTRLDDSVEAALEELLELAPIHNPPAIRLVRECRRRQPELPEVLVFDTSYHATIPEAARTYALPIGIRTELGLRKYGFHGISHQYVVQEAARFLGCPVGDLHAVSCHLGSGGASLCAVRNGRSVDNTMGYSPLQGLVMSTRCGDLDPGVTLQLVARQLGDGASVEQLLNRSSGVLGLSDFSADIRDVAGAPTSGGGFDLASQVYLWRIRKYLGAYLTAAAPARAVIFTDTIGETVPGVRAAVCNGLQCFGVELDGEANERPGPLPADVSARRSAVRVLVVPTNEELAMAREAWRVLTKTSGSEHPAPWTS
jgi:acetate kinase